MINEELPFWEAENLDAANFEAAIDVEEVLNAELPVREIQMLDHLFEMNPNNNSWVWNGFIRFQSASEPNEIHAEAQLILFEPNWRHPFQDRDWLVDMLWTNENEQMVQTFLTAFMQDPVNPPPINAELLGTGYPDLPRQTDFGQQIINRGYSPFFLVTWQRNDNEANFVRVQIGRED